MLVEFMPRWKKWLPNLLSFSRILFLPAIIWFLDNGYWFGVWLLFGAAVLTDYLDGKLSRHWNAASEFGASLDPLCDKILLLGILAYFWYGGFFSSSGNLLFWLLIFCEAAITCFRLPRLFGLKYDIRANWFGKIKMVVEVAAVTAILLHWPVFITPLLFLSCLLAILSLVVHLTKIE